MIRHEKARRAAEAERQRIANDAERIRARCHTLEGFIEEFCSILEPKRELKFGRALLAMCRHLTAVPEGLIQFLLITVPPGMMKSLLDRLGVGTARPPGYPGAGPLVQPASLYRSPIRE